MRVSVSRQFLFFDKMNKYNNKDFQRTYMLKHPLKKPLLDDPMLLHPEDTVVAVEKLLLITPCFWNSRKGNFKPKFVPKFVPAIIDVDRSFLVVLGLTLPSRFGGIKKTPSVEATPGTDELGVNEEQEPIDPTYELRRFFL